MPEVVVVGAGPVGMLLACLLAQEGIDVAVLEKRVGSDERTRAIGIHPPGLQALSAAGVGAEVLEEALSLDGGEVISRGRVRASLSFRPERRVLILPQHRTAALLRERLGRVAPGALQEGCTVLAVRDEETRVRVTFTSGGRNADLTASLVVAADGVHSGIRNATAIGWRTRAGNGSYAMVDVVHSGAPRAQLYCEPGGLVESFPLPGGMRRWVVRETSPLTTAPAFRAAIRERTGVQVPLGDETAPTRFQAAQHVAERIAQGRIVLLGDAAHELSPIGGQGMNLGWLGACRLVPAISSALRTGVPEFAAVDRRIRRAAVAAQRRSRFYMAMGSPAGTESVRARELLISTLGIPPLSGVAADLITMRGA